jgi:release factor glutamine methyltransferase
MEYIIGTATFAGLCFHCSKDTLIPTEWTTSLVEVALDLIKQRQQLENKQIVVDLGTGCGNIAVLLALRTDNVVILATDASAQAIDIARKNVAKFNVGNKVSLFCGDLFSPLYDSEYKTKIDLIVCNPPYIPTASLNNLHPEIINHQPIIALDAGPYGIDFYRRLITDSILMLKQNGQIAFEIGVGQEDVVSRLLTRNGNYRNIRFHKDSNGQHRVVSAIKTQ